ncbi:MAG: hypothetical protein ACW98I_12685 [Candidatus Hodarchaeales archaeon]|jgi:hypothetical protein
MGPTVRSEIEQPRNNKKINWRHVIVPLFLLNLVPILIIGLVLVQIPSPMEIPAFTIKGFIEHSELDSLMGKRIILIGIVSPKMNSTGFYLTDPEDSNSSYLVYIQAENIEKPLGFELDRIVVVEGKPVLKSQIWTIQASKISTKCPSSYD